MFPMGPLMRAVARQCSGLFSVALLGVLVAFHGLALSQQPPKPKEHVDFHSLKSLRAHIAKVRAQHKEGEGGKEEKEREEDGLDYLDALEWYLSVRAYPNDTVDWDALNSGLVHRDRMPSGGIPGAYLPGAMWEFLGPKNCSSPSRWAFGPGKISGRVACAAFDPANPLRIFLASAGGGVWRTNDGGTTWLPLGDGWSNITTSCVTIDPSNPLNIYVGTGDFDGQGGYSQGIMRSIDGGTTWTNVGNSDFGRYAVRRILVDPTNGQIVTAVTGRGAGGQGKVWRSTDGGNTWTAVITTSAYWSDIVCGPPDGPGNRTYFAAASGSGAAVWRSTDQGATWTKLTTPLRNGVSSSDTVDLACSPTTVGTVYVLGTGDRKVWKSTNFGGTWTDITGAAVTSANWGQAWYDFYLTCSTNGSTDVLYVGLIDILQYF
jgi:photosystem II stability/assembly factor-like uncharacterized protein